jgi:hypothetical protein
MKRRAFLGGLGASGALSMLDWLGYFRRFGVPGSPRELGIAKAAAQVVGEPRFLIYWFQEGGWDGYSMFNPVATRNDAVGTPTAPPDQQIYRPNIPLVNGLYPVSTAGAIKYGHLAGTGASLLPDMAIVSSHHGGTFHSGSRLNYHMGMYNYQPSGTRGPDERSVMQAFAEAYGATYLMSYISWHNWLSDGELSAADYPEGTGYYEKLGPSYAHTIYGGTPDTMRQRIAQIAASAGTGRDTEIHKFVDNLHTNFVNGKNSETVKAFSAAVDQHRTLVSAGSNIDTTKLFTDATLRAEFGIGGDDEKTTSTSVNGNPARSKNSPNSNVQALMAYELMTKGVSNAFWIESREVRGFDSHRNRAFVLQNKGQFDQKSQMDSNLWKPLAALVNRLKNTQYGTSGKSYWDYTTIVLASEMGRSMSGGDDDVCQHWDTNSVAFMGGPVKGGTQFGGVGSTSLDSIPLMPDGSTDPAYDPATGSLKSGASPSSQSFVPDAGHVYATALELTGIPKSAQKGKNTSPSMLFVKK